MTGNVRSTGTWNFDHSRPFRVYPRICVCGLRKETNLLNKKINQVSDVFRFCMAKLNGMMRENKGWRVHNMRLHFPAKELRRTNIIRESTFCCKRNSLWTTQQRNKIRDLKTTTVIVNTAIATNLTVLRHHIVSLTKFFRWNSLKATIPDHLLMNFLVSSEKVCTSLPNTINCQRPFSPWNTKLTISHSYS